MVSELLRGGGMVDGGRMVGGWGERGLGLHEPNEAFGLSYIVGERARPPIILTFDV